MEATSQLLGYIYHDYIICGFFNKSIPEKCEYLSVNEKNRDINILNPKEQRSLLDDKYRTYQLLKEWYGRDVILLKSADDYDAFADFFKKHRKGVKKPFAGAKGKSIELIEVSEENMRAVFEQYIKKEAFVLEEQIVAHPKMRAIYSGSVNTIRVNTLVDGEEVRYILPHMRFGYGGSFIDNVSSGGYMVSVDIDRGVIDSDAYKSSGECINAHPDTGVVFKGYEIPEVDELRRVTKEIALKMAAEQRLYLVGWDMALTDAGKWVVIEGNGNSGITHAQRLVGHGCKDYYRSTVGPVKERLMKEQNPEEKNY